MMICCSCCCYSLSPCSHCFTSESNDSISRLFNAAEKRLPHSSLGLEADAALHARAAAFEVYSGSRGTSLLPLLPLSRSFFLSHDVSRSTAGAVLARHPPWGWESILDPLLHANRESLSIKSRQKARNDLQKSAAAPDSQETTSVSLLSRDDSWSANGCKNATSLSSSFLFPLPFSSQISRLECDSTSHATLTVAVVRLGRRTSCVVQVMETATVTGQQQER